MTPERAIGVYIGINYGMVGKGKRVLLLEMCVAADLKGAIEMLSQLDG